LKEITIDTKIATLLEIDGMKDTLIAINPKFKKLNNPVLRRTLAKVASVKQAAIVGGMDPVELLNKLRESVGQEPIQVDLEQKESKQDIITKEPKIVINANEILDKEQNPLAITRKALKELQKGEVLMILSDFKPEPLIDEFSKDGYKINSTSSDDKNFKTFIEK